MWEDWNAESQLAWERAVFSRVRRGDVEAFGLLYDVFAKRLVRHVLAPRLADPAQIEDALAETFTRAFAARARYVPGETSAYFWLARIAERIALDVRRASVRRLSFLRAFSEEPTSDVDGPEETYASHEKASHEREALTMALERISPRHRAAIELRVLDERPREECATRLGVSVGTFDVLLLRAVRALERAAAETSHER